MVRQFLFLVELFISKTIAICNYWPTS